MIVITIPNYRARSRNKTVAKHWSRYVEQRNEIAELIGVYTPSRECLSPAVVSIMAFFKGSRGVDTSNVDDKIIVDGLMRVGILKDDTPSENPRVIKDCYVDTGKDELVITVDKISLDKMI